MARHGDVAFEIVRILVVGITTETGVKPVRRYSASRGRDLALAACRTWIGFPQGGQFCRGLGVNRT
jgi:hypothetical protein